MFLETFHKVIESLMWQFTVIYFLAKDHCSFYNSKPCIDIAESGTLYVFPLISIGLTGTAGQL